MSDCIKYKNNLDAVLNGDYFFYVATRLFDYTQKIQAEYLDKTIHIAIFNLLKRKIHTHKFTFVPFRDIDQYTINEENKSVIIFEHDIAKLSSGKVIALVGIFNDISKDDGIAFEIGYCFAKGIPIILMNTDFIWYRTISDQQQFIFDPIIQRMCHSMHHTCSIPKKGECFNDRLKTGFNNALDIMRGDVTNFLISDFSRCLDDSSTTKTNTPIRKVFVDFCGNKCEYHRAYANSIKQFLLSRGIDCHISKRYSPELTSSLSERAVNDIEYLAESQMLIISGEEPEIDSGTAALTGMAYAEGKIIVLYYSGNIEILGGGNQRMKKNLMLEQAATKLCTSFEELVLTLSTYLTSK